MTRSIPRRALAALFAVTSFGVAGSASAHFPVARAVSLESGGSGTRAAIALPGFGLVMRRDAAQPFSYLCDALLGVEQSDNPPAMVFVGDGSLLVGTGSGLRHVSREGCPRETVGGDLESQPVVALAVHPGASRRVYAVTGEAEPRVAASEDGGLTWEMRARLPAGGRATALVLDETDPDVVYVSQSAPAGGATLRVSQDSGVSFATFNAKDGLVLLDVEPRRAADAGRGRLWAVGRDRTKSAAFAVLHAEAPEGPWTSALTVNYFGGFARAPDGVLWVGDEGGGVHRSVDGGVTFADVAPHVGLACLGFAQGSLFGCTPGLADQTALVRWNDDHQSFDDVIALSGVRQMVECGTEADAPTICKSAWVEWQRDVIGLPSAALDAGPSPGDSGISGDAGKAPEPSRASGASGGCSVPGGAGASKGRSRSSSRTVWAFGILLMGVSGRRRGRG